MSRLKHTNIAVVETRWWAKSNTSVRGLFDLVADIHCDNPHAYHYEMANSEVAAKEAITRIGVLKHCKYLYIAAHGDAKGICFEGEQRLSRSEIKNAINAIRGSHFTGLYIGSCAFGTQELAEYFFKEGVKLKWIAGYNRPADWVKSSSLDLLVFNELLGRPGETVTPSGHLAKSLQKVYSLASGLVKDLGFGFYVPRKGVGGARNLMEPAK